MVYKIKVPPWYASLRGVAESVDAKLILFFEMAKINLHLQKNARATSPWKYFTNIQEKEFSGIEEVIAKLDANVPVEVYDLKGVRVADTTENLPAGLYIIRQGSLTKKVTVK